MNLAPTRRLARFGLALVALGLLSGCSSRAPIGLSPSGTAEPTPTIAAIFSMRPTVPPASEPMDRPAATPVPAAGSSGPASVEDRLTELVIYDDTLSPSWTLDNSAAIEYTTQGTDFVDRGRFAIKATARANFSTLYFTVQRGSRATFRRDQVLGLRFRLSGGRGTIPNDAIAITVVGSNRQPYWVPNDTSVKIEGRVTEDLPLFSETRLYYLDINTTIPAGDWVDVYVWLDDLVNDPDYTYLTGFYLKTDELDRFYLDDVALLTAP